MGETSAPRLLTKSLFKMALECPTKLFYSAPNSGYLDRNKDDDFLQALADGGHQIGELAKYKYHQDPVGAGITVESLNRDEAVAHTQTKLASPQRVVIAEAALLVKPYFIRVDVLIHDPVKRVVEIIEVKSKSVDSKTVANGFKNTKGAFDRPWLPYLYDVAFQAEVARLRFPGYTIVPKLLLIDSEVVSDVDGLHQLFAIETTHDNGRSRTRVSSPGGITQQQLGRLDFLREIDARDVVAELRHQLMTHSVHIPNEAGIDMPTFMSWAATLLEQDERCFLNVSKTCRSCQFRAPEGAPEKSGVHECWQLAKQQGLIQGATSGGSNERATPLSIDLWGGGAGARSFADIVLRHSRAYLSDIQADDIRPKTPKAKVGMSAFERRLAQVSSAHTGGKHIELREERLDDMDGWQWPLHMIDFETSAPAIPFFKGMRPYETLAFQFSHHTMSQEADGQVRINHASQWISTAAGEFPSIEFVRQLRKALMPDGVLHGTVFRYHNHENTVLRSLRALITRQPAQAVPDAAELTSFIDLITKATGDEEDDIGEFVGDKPMVDLHRLVQEGYFSKHMKGSISLKYVLPAVLHDAPGVASLYAKPNIYGQNLAIGSLNFDAPHGHQWLQADKSSDPYKTLPPVFAGERAGLNAMLQKLAGDDDEDATIAQGGLAMTAYNFTQFAALTDHERSSIANALLRYCELDTLAMVMLVQGLMELRGKPLTIAMH